MDEAEIRSLLEKLTVAEKARLVTGADFWTLHSNSKIGLRPLVCSDGPNGVRGTSWDERDTSLLLPVGSVIGATWDREAAKRAGELFGDEALRRGVHVVLAPTVNLHRSPFGGRDFENFSEDPMLVGELGAAVVNGIQAKGVGATPKHYVANDSETERLTYNAAIDETTLREVYLEPFRRIVAKARPWAMMAAYNSVNGRTMTENSTLVNDILKDEWGWDGVLMSDWFATRSVKDSAAGGLDLAMPGPSSPWSDGALQNAVENGEVAQSMLDDKVLRLLRLADRVGVLGGKAKTKGEIAAPPERARSAIRELTTRGFVLLRNQTVNRKPALPLAEDVGKVAVIGENAMLPAVQGGGSSQVNAPHVITPLDGIRNALPNAEVTYRRGVWHRRLLDPIQREDVEDPEGEGTGFRVEYLDAQDRVVGSELRGTERLVWQNDGLPEGTAKIRLRGQLRTEVGDHAFGVSGTGRFRVDFGGRQVLDSDVTREHDVDDPLADLVEPPEERCSVLLVDSDLKRGRIGVSVEFTPKDLHAELIVLGVGHRSNRPDDRVELESALAAAREADVVVVVVGTNDEVETEGRDRATLDLPGQQNALVASIAAVNPNTAVVVNAGAPVLLPWAGQVPAVLWTWFGGQEYGDALAEVLLGKAEPGGRLPTTLPAELADLPVALPGVQPVDGLLRYSEGANIGYRGYDANGKEPAFHFGHGLGYTTWEYLAADRNGAQVKVKLRNSGERRGREVVQIYDAEPLRLAGFATTAAEPGETVEVVVDVESTSDELRVGRSSSDLRITATSTTS